MALAAAINIQQSPSNSGGTPASQAGIPGVARFSDVGIKGAFQVNPAYAGDFYAGVYNAEHAVPGGHEPLEVKDRVKSQRLAAQNSPNAWKKRTLPRYSDPILFGTGAPQPPMRWPWNKKFIPPLALFNDASGWVNRLLLHKPMNWFGADTSDFPLKAQYSVGPPPINIDNLAAGNLNLQLQLGTMAIQRQELSLKGSNYYG